MSLKGKRILIFAAPLYEDLELWYPKIRLEEEGASTTVAGMGEKTYPGKRGYPVTVDTNVDQVESSDFDALVIPGGFAPDQLRRSDKVLRLTREIYQAGKPVAFICHAGWVPISAKILKGKRATSVRYQGRHGKRRGRVGRQRSGGGRQPHFLAYASRFAAVLQSPDWRATSGAAGLVRSAPWE